MTAAIIIAHNDYMFTVIHRYLSQLGDSDGKVNIHSYSITPNFFLYSGDPAGEAICTEKSPGSEILEGRLSFADAQRWLEAKREGWLSAYPSCFYRNAKCGGKVTWGPDPFELDLHGDDTRVWICADHRYESAQDI